MDQNSKAGNLIRAYASGHTFEPSAHYQEENGVSEQMTRTIMDMVRATILEGNIEYMVWPEIVLAMTYVISVRLTRALEGSISPYKSEMTSVQTSSTFES